MASNGSLNTNGYQGRYLTFSWSVTSQSIENNRTTISWSLKGAGTGEAGYYYAGNFGVSIDGTWVYLTGQNDRIKLWNGTAVASGTYTFNHNNDGTRSFAVTVQAGIYTYAVNCKGSTTFTIDPIPRATTPTVSGSLSLGSTITIDTSNRASSNFTHNLYYSWGSQVIDSLIASGVNTSRTWTIPKMLAEYIQAGTSGTMFLKCVTYNGSTEIGTKTLTLTITVPDTREFQPTIQSISAVDANDLPLDRYVVGKSRLKFTISAVGGYVDGSSNRNSYLAKAVVTVDGISYSVTLGQYASSTIEVTTNELTKAGGLYAMVTVTDSRGRTAGMSFAYTAYDYFTPEINTFKAQRCLEDGTLNDSGSYVLFNLKTTIASIDDLNAKTYKIIYENNGSEIVVKSGTLAAYEDNTLVYNSYDDGVSFSVDYSWVVRVYVYDSFNSSAPAVATVIVPTEATFMDWRENGKGWAFGKVSTKNAFECAWDMYDRFDTVIGNGLAKYTGSGDYAIDPDTTLDHCVLTDKNTPKPGFWHVVTLFYSSKKVDSNRTQYALPYSSRMGAFYRYYYNGVWTEWIAIDAPVTVSTGEAYGHMIFADGRKVCWGKIAIMPTAANVVTSVTINFPVTFTKAPNITTMPHTSVPNIISFGVGAGTQVSDALTKMVIYMTRTNMVSTSFFWRAEGY